LLLAWRSNSNRQHLPDLKDHELINLIERSSLGISTSRFLILAAWTEDYYSLQVEFCSVKWVFGIRFSELIKTELYRLWNPQLPNADLFVCGHVYYNVDNTTFCAKIWYNPAFTNHQFDNA